MSVIALKDVQATAKAQLDASAYTLAHAIPVFIDDGRKLSKIEQALSQAGHCIAVSLPLSAARVGQATGAANIRIQMEATALINPEKSGLDPVECFDEIGKALLGYAVDNQADRFELGETQDSIFESVDGLFAVTVRFTKLTFIKAD